MIQIRCRSNDDKLKNEEWPYEVLIPPQENHLMVAESGRRARIVKIAHIMSYGEPILEIELAPIM